jgi:phosphoenolpyruvate-protein phosphotransferase
MPRTFAFVCPLRNGMHARPASALEDVARRFASSVSITNERGGRVADAKSVLAIVGAEIRFGDSCTVTVDGVDEGQTLTAIAHFLDHDLARYATALPPPQVTPGAIRLPPVLRAARAEVRTGTPVSPGIARGRAVRIGGIFVADAIPRHSTGSRDSELTLLGTSLDAVLQNYDSKLAQLADGVEADVLKAHRSVTCDPEFRRRLEASIRESGCTVAGAIESADAYFTAMLFGTGSQLLRERALDVRDVCVALLRQAYGAAVRPHEVALTGDSVCLADSLTPGQLLALDRRHLKGLVLGHAGMTSHTVILARSFGIPALVGVPHTGDLADGNADVIVDADLGALVANPTPAVLRYYDLEAERVAARRERLRQFAGRDAATEDGRRIRVAANIASADETAQAIGAGAEGIGLFRTEILFLDREEAPPEEEQFEQYRRALEQADGRPVVIRTLDVGGDKPIAYLPFPREDNPFLGNRAVRLYPAFEALFRDQVRALVRASAFGRLEVMIPMVSSVEEMRWVKRVIADEQRHCAQDGLAHDAAMAVGAMIEVPSAAFLLDHFCRELDFFSIGTNDLLQYVVAADRTNPKVSGLYQTAEPAFLRVLKRIVDDVHAGRSRVGLCGEMAGQIEFLPLLIGLGVDELSMAAPNVAEVKAELPHLSSAACHALAAEALACSTADEVAALLERFRRTRAAPLIEPDLVILDADCRSKEEAIKRIVDRLYVTGRTDRPRDVEDAVWQRETVTSTGFGHGFALPYCKSDAVRASSLAVLRLRTPVEWGSVDGRPVQVLVLLTSRESAQPATHMQLLAGLARQLMLDEVRARLTGTPDARSLCEFLEAAISGSGTTEDTR